MSGGFLGTGFDPIGFVANSQIVDTYQGQEGGFKPFGSASITGAVAGAGGAGGYYSPVSTTKAPTQNIPNFTIDNNAGVTVAGITPQQQAQQDQATTQLQAQAAQATQDRLNAGQINTLFDQARGGLIGQRDTLRNQSGILSQRIGKNFGANKGFLQTSLDQGRGNIDAGREKVGLGATDTLRELSQQIRNALSAGNIRLGVAGASDSSAAGQLGFALSNLQNKNRAQTLRESNRQLSDLDLEERNLEIDFQNQLGQLQLARDNKLEDITASFGDKINAINAELAGADSTRREALALLKVDIANDALGQVTQLDADLGGFLKQMQAKATQGFELANRARLESAGEGFAPRFSQFAQGSGDVRLQASDTGLNDLSFFTQNKKKKDETIV